MTAFCDDDGIWLVNLLMKLKPDMTPIKVDETPHTMTSSASWKAFTISTVAAIPPGPLGVMTILPELLAVTRIQIGLIFRIAEYYGKQATVNSTIVALILGNAAGIAIGRELTSTLHGKVIIRKIADVALQRFIANIGAKVLGRIIARVPIRLIPLLTAPVFGALSKTATTRIGEEAMMLFSQDFEAKGGETN